MGVTACQDPHETPGTAATPSRTAARATDNTRTPAPPPHDAAPAANPFYSHSIVAGGFEEMSRAQRLTPRISLMMRLETRSRRS